MLQLVPGQAIGVSEPSALIANGETVLEVLFAV